ncbi:MAG TPA: serine/threonine-protein kinase [Planctomycetota bacterium]|nr:serine/threonine-protein kinase [Planctomycetota bacterium]
MYKHREADLLFARLALLERLVSPSQIQKAMGLLRRIAEAGGTPPTIGEVLVGEKLLSEEQSRGLAARLAEANQAITDAQAGLHEVPRRVGRYELLERIGRGGMGAVYRARQLNMDRVVALKVLAPHLTRDAKYIRQFIREARAAGQINHANIVAVHEVGEADGHFFICMEYVQGRTLSRELLARRRIPPAEVLDYAAQVAEALAAAEKSGVVHRDIKPDNLIRTPKGQIKVTDLGLAKRLSDVTSASQTGWACGTPYYMAPEQARDSRKVDTRSDIYSLGATLYHLATGRLPFEGNSSVEVLMHAATDRLVPPAILCPEVPQALSDLIERMMAREPENRPQTAAALIGEIAACRGEVELEATGRGSARTPRHQSVRGPGGAATQAGPPGMLLTAVWAAAALAVTGVVVELVVPTGQGAVRPAPDQPPVRPQPDVQPPPPLPPGMKPEEVRRDAAMHELFGRMRAALADPQAAGWTRLAAECDTALPSAGRWAPVLERSRADLVSRAESLAIEELDRRRWLAAEAAAWGRSAEALARLEEFARAWPGTAAAANALTERTALDERSARQKADAEAIFAAWLAAERFDRAAELVAAVPPEGPRGARLASELAASRRASEERTAALHQERAALAAKLAAIERSLAVWDFASAQDQAEKACALLPARSPTRRRLELIGARAVALGQFRARLCERLNSMTRPLADTQFADKPLGMSVASADERGIRLATPEAEGVSTQKSWAALSAVERWKLASAVARPRSQEDLAGLALLCIGAGRTADAARYLDEAEKFGGGNATHREELALLAAGDAEAEAERQEASIRRHLAEGHPAEALTGIGRLLTRLRQTAWVAARSTILERLAESAEGDCAASGLFSGRARELPPGWFRVEYDFAGPAAALDWQQTEPAGDGPARLVWLREFAGEFTARFSLSGEFAGARLVLAPRPEGSGAPLRFGRNGPEEPPAGPETAAAGAGPGTPAAGALADGMELGLSGGELLWRTPDGSGRFRLPAATLDALASRRITGWGLILEMPAGGAGAVSARLDCRLSAAQQKLLAESRTKLAAEQYSRAMRLTDPLLRAGDLRRMATEHRDSGPMAAAAEMDRARALLEAGQSAEARWAVEEFMAAYPSQSALFPDARRLLARIIGRER